MSTKPVSIRIGARLEKGALQVRTKIMHPMESGLPGQTTQGRVQSFDKYLAEGGAEVSASGRRKLPSPHFLTEVRLEINSEPVALVHLGPGVSQDPVFGWRIAQGRAGDRVRIVWRNNLGETGQAETVVP